MKKINKKLTRSVMAIVLGGVMGMGVLMPRAEAEFTATIGGATIAYSSGTPNYPYGVAIGEENLIGEYCEDSVAMGYYNTVSDQYSVAMGSWNTVNGSNSFAMGNCNTVNGFSSVAMGKGLTSGKNNTSWSEDTPYNGADYTAAFGHGNKAIASGAFVAGGAGEAKWVDDLYWEVSSNPNTASGKNAVAMGEGNTASGLDSFVMGSGSTASGNYSVAMGNGAVAGAANITYSAGAEQQTTAYNSDWDEVTAIVTEKLVTTEVVGGNEAVAMGSSQAYGNYSTAQGKSQTGYTYQIDGEQYTLKEVVYNEDGYTVQVDDNDPTKAKIVANTYTNKVTKVIGGEYATSAGTGKAYGDYSIAMGNGAQTGEVVTDPNKAGEYIVQGGIGAVALGTNVKAIGNYSVAMGNSVVASGDYATAFGWGSTEKYTEGEHAAEYKYGATGAGSFVAGGVGANYDYNKKCWVLTGSSKPNTASGINAVAMGEGNTASGFASFVMGSRSTASGDYSVAMGHYGIASGECSIALGQAYAYGVGSFAVGSCANADGNDSIAIGSYSSAYGMGSIAMMAGKAYGLESLAVGSSSQTGAYYYDGEYRVIGVGGKYAVAMGNEAKAYADNSVAFGSSTTGILNGDEGGSEAVTVTGGSYALAAGNSTAIGNYSVAMGHYSIAGNNYSVAIGNDAQTGALWWDEEAVGYKYVGGKYAVAMGNEAKAYAEGSVAFGRSIAGAISGIDGGTSEVTVTGGSYAFAAGSSTASGDYSVAMGEFVYAGGDGAVAFGKGVATGAGTYEAPYVIDTNYGAIGDYSLVSGFHSTASGAYSVAMGNGAVATPDNSFAFGGSVGSAAIAGIALGYQSSVTGANSVALGAGSVANGSNEVSVGSSTQTRKITNVTAGTADTDAVNYGQLKSVTGMGSTAGSIYAADATVVEAVKSIDGKIGALSADGTYIKTTKTVSENLSALDSAVNTLNATGITAEKVAQIETNKNSITAIQEYVKTTGLDANSNKITNVAVGTADTDAANLGQVKGYSTVSVAGTAVTNTGTGVNFVAGNNVSITTLDNTITISAAGGIGEGTDSTLLGKDSTASAEGSTAIGYNNTVSGKYSTAVGYKNTVTGNNSGAFGDPNDISGNSSYAVGNNNTIAGDNNFVLGNNVNVGSNVTNSVALGNDSTVTESNVVSVGSETVKRKITNVAAGTSAYDAVNYGQYTELANTMERGFSKVNEDIGRTGAASAALASLHPQMMRKGESQIMAGMGRYHGKSGAAVGLAWQPHKRIMLSGGFADAAGEIMFNFGASYKFGQHSYTAEQLAEINNGTGLPLYVAELNAVLKSKDVQIMNLKSDNAAIKADNAAMKNRLEKLEIIVADLLKAKN